MTKKVVFGLVGLLWLLALMQMSGSAKNQDEHKVIRAFSRVDYSESRCTLEISSSAGSGYYLAGEREELLKSFAADLGITMGYELSEVRDGGRLESINGTVPIPINLPASCGFCSRCPVKLCGLCEKAYPKLVDRGEGHYVSCFLYGEEAEEPVETDAGNKHKKERR